MHGISTMERMFRRFGLVFKNISFVGLSPSGVLQRILLNYVSGKEDGMRDLCNLFELAIALLLG